MKREKFHVNTIGFNDGIKLCRKYQPINKYKNNHKYNFGQRPVEQIVPRLIPPINTDKLNCIYADDQHIKPPLPEALSLAKENLVFHKTKCTELLQRKSQTRTKVAERCIECLRGIRLGDIAIVKQADIKTLI